MVGYTAHAWPIIWLLSIIVAPSDIPAHTACSKNVEYKSQLVIVFLEEYRQ